MKKKKDILFYLAFFAFIIFINTPYGLGTRVALTKGVTAIKTAVFPPKASDTRQGLSSYNLALRSIHNATDVNLENLNGEVVFINHWATWCPPCRAEMPSLYKLYGDYKDKVRFIFLTNESAPIVSKYYTAKGFDFPTYNPASAVPNEINTSSLPATFVIDKQRRVVLKEYGPADWNSSAVRELLDSLIDEQKNPLNQ